MTPYGILFSENAYCLEQSVSIFQKKFGVLKMSVILKISALLCLLFAVIYGLTGAFLKDELYIYLYVLQCVTTVVSVYMTVKQTAVKSVTQETRSKGELQIVFYDEKLVVTTPYSKIEYYYDEIRYACERNGCITLIVEGVMLLPMSIPSMSLIKGDYKKVCSILREKLGTTFDYKEAESV